MSEHAQATHAPHASTHDPAHATALGVDSRKMGVWAFIGSETLFFAALIATYLI
jgi:cytochrome c oxidase subunit III